MRERRELGRECYFAAIVRQGTGKFKKDYRSYNTYTTYFLTR